MRIGILGAGNVGGTLGRRLAEAGHDVAFGVRQPAKGATAVKGGDSLPPRARAVSPADAVKGADAVLLSTPWGAAQDALREAGADRGALDGLVLLDATNPIKAGFVLDVGPSGESGAERIQAAVPNAKVVKVFNTTGFNNMQNPAYDGASTVMFYAGDDTAAKRVAHDLAAALGFDAVDAGNLVQARLLEQLAMLWIALAYGAAGAPALGRDFAFRLVRR
jgi:predicted dinucleotide-binding enzyme